VRPAGAKKGGKNGVTSKFLILRKITEGGKGWETSRKAANMRKVSSLPGTFVNGWGRVNGLKSLGVKTMPEVAEVTQAKNLRGENSK